MFNKKLTTEDKNLDWLLNYYRDLYVNKTSSFKQIYEYIKNGNMSYLTISVNPFPVDHRYQKYFPDNGFVSKECEIILENDKKYNEDAANILALLIHYDYPFKSLNYTKEDMSDILSKALILGSYEKYGLNFEDLLDIALKRKVIMKEDFANVCVTRGMILGNRYKTRYHEWGLVIKRWWNSWSYQF